MSLVDAPARKAAKLALLLLKRTCTYQRAGDPTENISTGAVTPNYTNATLRCALTRVKRDLVDGTLVRATDMMVLLDPISFETAYGAGAAPAQEDRIVIAGETLQTVRPLPVSGGEQWALHKVIVRR